MGCVAASPTVCVSQPQQRQLQPSRTPKPNTSLSLSWLSSFPSLTFSASLSRTNPPNPTNVTTLLSFCSLIFVLSIDNNYN